MCIGVTIYAVGDYRPWASSSGVRATMRGNRRRDTKPEMAVRRAVHALGLRYRVDSRPLQGLNRRADLVFASARVAVFVDGCYWHGCPEHGTAARTNAGYWSKKIQRNRIATPTPMHASGRRVGSS